MIEFLAFTLDKFTFKVATDRCYNASGVWAKADGDQITVGVSDFFQQHNGDVAFAEVEEVGTAVSVDDIFANIETIKVDADLPAPVSGVITAVNERLEMEAEIINQDPYGQGWLAKIVPTNWAADQAEMLAPAAYLEQMKAQVLEETE